MQSPASSFLLRRYPLLLFLELFSRGNVIGILWRKKARQFFTGSFCRSLLYEILSLKRIICVVIELFTTICVANVTPGTFSNCVILIPMRRDSRSVPKGLGIFQQRFEAHPFQMAWCRQSTEVGKRRIDVHEIDWDFAEYSPFS